ncbi:hypothetical protein EGW08_006548 [Elysia chlorotica]|uniref:SEFIR domain-containing protein n=1 Tax=Elysia chlorotica TaxID=188477 RepID=A0A433TVW3_ELYCH|nr:hypothetical protein EGW08_006548 [Elysia chlorotica]
MSVRVSVTSLPMDLNKPRNTSILITLEKGKKTGPKWNPDLKTYLGNVHDLVLTAAAHPDQDIEFFDIALVCRGELEKTTRFFRPNIQLKEKQVHLILAQDRFIFEVPGPFPQDKNCIFEVDYQNPVTKSFVPFEASEPFNYSFIDIWEPAWNPHLQGVQMTSPGSRDVDASGHPLTHIIMEKPIKRAAFYHLQILQMLAHGNSQRPVVDHTFKNIQSSEAQEVLRMSLSNDGRPEFVVPGIILGHTYTYSMKALDSGKQPLDNVKQLNNEPLIIIGKRDNSSVTVELVATPTMDNRMRIVLGLVIAAFLLLALTTLAYCLSQRAARRLATSGSLWRPNNSTGVKVLPIYCYENEHYEAAVKRHVTMMRQYACTSPSLPGEPRPESRPRCWSSLVAWLLARNQETIGKDMEAEIKSSEIIIYLSPGLGHLMSPDSVQSAHSCDLECAKLLSTLRRLHCRGLSRRPHLVTFDCFGKAELVCLDSFHWMTGATRETPRQTFRDGQPQETVSFLRGSASASAGTERRAQEPVQVLYNHLAPADVERDQSDGLLSPLVLAAQVSGAWQLQNVPELLARLRDCLDYPEHQRLTLAVTGPTEGWRNSPEVRAIEHHLQQAAWLYRGSHQDTQTHIFHGAVVDAARDIENGSPLCDCSVSFSSPPYRQQHNSKNCGPNRACTDTLLCTFCGKIKQTGRGNVESDSNGKTSDLLGSINTSRYPCTTALPCESPPAAGRAGEAAVSFQGCDGVQLVKDCDRDSVDSSDNDCSSGFSSPRHKKILNSSSQIKMNASSCSDLNHLSSSNSYSPMFEPARVILPPLLVNDKHPLGFSQDIIPPDQCRSKTGFTLEHMAQLNADSGWSQDNLDLVYH